MSGTTIGAVLGAVIPFIIGISYYICKFIIKIRHEGLKNITLEEWKEFGRNIEGEIESILGETFKVDSHCEHCQNKLERINTQVGNLHKKIKAVQGELVERVDSKVSSIQQRDQENENKTKKKIMKKIKTIQEKLAENTDDSKGAPVQQQSQEEEDQKVENKTSKKFWERIKKN